MENVGTTKRMSSRKRSPAMVSTLWSGSERSEEYEGKLRGTYVTNKLLWSHSEYVIFKLVTSAISFYAV